MPLFRSFGRRRWQHLPNYLTENYWWAYLWKPALWFFDHQVIINLILFRHYQPLADETLARIGRHERFLQMTCVYGNLTGKVKAKLGQTDFHIMDIANEQLELTGRKNQHQVIHFSRMNAEHLAYGNNTFDGVLIFFLFHEMPRDARERSLAEAIRVLKPDGTLYITEYGQAPEHHLLYRNTFFRGIIAYLEPFLSEFWHWPMQEKIIELCKRHGCRIQSSDTCSVFNGFYRVTRFSFAKEPVEARQTTPASAEVEA